MNIQIKCEHCGALFTPNTMKQIYCSKECRSKHNSYKKKESYSPKYYYYSPKGKYCVRKNVNGVLKYFGVFNSEEEAQAMVELLKQNNWCLDEIQSC